MQPAVVAVVLPPPVLPARARRHQRVRVIAALLTGVAAVGWLGARPGIDNPVATRADRLGLIALPVVVSLAAAILTAVPTPSEATAKPWGPGADAPARPSG
ncbi:hypothetical protein SAMN04488543_3219 [Friedmanniella luteola]|uniref:Uncharacterized protein n=1 Tax=Friedmanniella luteola TaxID=546871 RepID=A0A1H1Y8T1_9ACTN|nr:hypothetical protein SAMN04488543_3219 [Friedmanniella luteola]